MCGRQGTYRFVLTQYLISLCISTLVNSIRLFQSYSFKQEYCLFDLSYGILTAHSLVDLCKICIGEYTAWSITHHQVIGLNLAQVHGYLICIIEQLPGHLKTLEKINWSKFSYQGLSTHRFMYRNAISETVNPEELMSKEGSRCPEWTPGMCLLLYL